ncbi:hypothetical protein LOTGIDRAFT_154730 [Lottia gigantea]|uniref:Uncharacterized protein n=1 Tax=Lottia gigantea TaxID=225164 RepID=V3ZS84_LOTGI|nr:hypothetical protein LOTGIDRAFT_154730 [Lottia gigantea]ESO87227.1 hypothetical protein LOTGIDRAFT_154730 [Lottia gigantea]
MTLTGESTTWPITNTIKPARYLMVGFKNLPDSQTNNNNLFRVAMNQTQDPLIHKVQVRLNNDNYPNQPLTINPTTKDYNELYRNYKNMCELFGNPPQFEYVDFALNHPIFCFDLSAHQEDLFKTGVNINIHIEKTQGDVTGARDDIDLERIDANAKEGGFLPFLLPLIFDGIAAAGAATGRISAAVKAANAKKAADAKAAEERRHNLIMEKEAKGSGVGDMIGTIKEFGKRFGEETKKIVKQGLNKLVDSIDTGEVKVKHKVPVLGKLISLLTCGQHLSYYQYPQSFRIFTKQRCSRQEEVEIKDIIDNYIEAKNPTDIKVFLTKNVNDLDLSNIDSNRKNLILFDDCVAQRHQAVQQELFTKGRHHKCHCIYQSKSFYGMDSMFIRKNANCFLLFELNDKDLSQIIQSINHGMDRDAFKKVCKTKWKNPGDHGYIFVNTRKPAGERVMTDIY